MRAIRPLCIYGCGSRAMVTLGTVDHDIKELSAERFAK
jgi:hypothetical protein